MEEERTALYTFTQPVRGGYYYIVVKASSSEEAVHIITDIVGSIKRITGRLRVLSQYPEGTLVLGNKMQERLDDVGYAHRFVRVHAAPYHERVGHRGFLPE